MMRLKDCLSLLFCITLLCCLPLAASASHGGARLFVPQQGPVFYAQQAPSYFAAGQTACLPAAAGFSAGYVPQQQFFAAPAYTQGATINNQFFFRQRAFIPTPAFAPVGAYGIGTGAVNVNVIRGRVRVFTR